jgi:2-phosphosulfolactate phosphatase
MQTNPDIGNADRSVFDQAEYCCRLEWGRDGARRAARRGDVLVIVDVLRFSTTVATALHHGGVVYPCVETEDVREVAARLGAEPAARTSAEGRFTLSPSTYKGMPAGTRVCIASLNGATCSRYAADVPRLFVGGLVNARAVGAAVRATVRDDARRRVTVVACGERRVRGADDPPTEDGDLRIAIEDYLGAGAILSLLPFSRSPEAELCEMAFRNAQPSLSNLLLDCGSGRELTARGLTEDVQHAARLDLYKVVPVMRDGWLVDAAAPARAGRAV